MNTVRCPLCKKMYQFTGLPPKCCPECYFKEEAQYQMVRDLVQKRPGINIITVAELTGVPHTKILHYLREDRLEAMPGNTEFCKCQSCGKIINTGTHCTDCSRRLGEKDKTGHDNPDNPDDDDNNNDNQHTQRGVSGKHAGIHSSRPVYNKPSNTYNPRVYNVENKVNDRS